MGSSSLPPQALATWESSRDLIFSWQELLLFAHSHIILKSTGYSDHIKLVCHKTLIFKTVHYQSNQKKKKVQKVEAAKWFTQCSWNFWKFLFSSFIKQNWPQKIKQYKVTKCQYLLLPYCLIASIQSIKMFFLLYNLGHKDATTKNHADKDFNIKSSWVRRV